MDNAWKKWNKARLIKELHPYAEGLDTKRTTKTVLQQMYEQKLSASTSSGSGRQFASSASQTEVRGPDGAPALMNQTESGSAKTVQSTATQVEVQALGNNPVQVAGQPSNGTPTQPITVDAGEVQFQNNNFPPGTGAAQIATNAAWSGFNQQSDPLPSGPAPSQYDLVAKAMDTMADLAKAMSAKASKEPSSRYTLDTAIKALDSPNFPEAAPPSVPITGQHGVPMGSLPHIELVSPELREDILKGKDINLATLLIPNYRPESYHREMVIGQEAVPLKPLTDSRLNRQLTIQEFLQAFSIYKSVMCRKYPLRREELDLYERSIIEMSSRFGGYSFYEYHKSFSSRAAQYLATHNIKIDWSVRDNDLFCTIFAGHKANACNICSSLSHSTMFCGEMQKGNTNSNQNSGSKSYKKYYYEGKEICRLFNFGTCPRPSCSYIHRCITCHSQIHGAKVCQQKAGSPASANALPKSNQPAPQNKA